VQVGDKINYRGKPVTVGRIDGNKICIEWSGHQKWVPIDIDAINKVHYMADYRNPKAKLDIEEQVKMTVKNILAMCEGSTSRLANEALKVGVAITPVRTIREQLLQNRITPGMATMRLRNLIAGKVRRDLK